MARNIDTQIAIIGAGLAGTLVAEALLERGYPADEIALVDPGVQGSRASDAPGALMHAIPGRSLAPKEGTMEAYVESVAWHEKWREKHPELIHRSTMTRPDFGHRQGRRYVNTWKDVRETYPETLESELLDASQCAELLPAMKPARRAVNYGPAYCVTLGDLLEQISRELRAQGLRSIEACVTHLHENKDNDATTWTLLGEDDQPILTARAVVLCPGSQLPRWFPELPVAINGGELLTGVPPAGAELHGFLSGGGHIATRSDGGWVYGATYIRPPEDAEDPHDEAHFIRPEEEAIEAIEALIGRLIPRISEVGEVAVWRGQRAVFLTDRQPLAGAVPEHENLFMLGAMGSKGLLWAPSLAKMMGALLDTRSKEPTEERPHHLRARASRAGASKPERWRSPRITRD